MKVKNIKVSFEKGLKVVELIQSTQQEQIEQSATLVVDAYKKGKKFFVTGSGHSHTVAEELYGRAGQLAFVVPIINDELTLTNHPTKSTYIERLSGYAKILVDLYRINEGDVILIASNSGRNAYPIEMALEAKTRGAKVIAITSLKHSKQVDTRHECGKKLYEIADVVIDNCGEKGDAATIFEGVKPPMIATSSIANAFICNAFGAAIVEKFVEEGIEPEVFFSANVDGGEEKNQKLMDKYTRMYY